LYKFSHGIQYELALTTAPLFECLDWQARWRKKEIKEGGGEKKRERREEKLKRKN